MNINKLTLVKIEYDTPRTDAKPKKPHSTNLIALEKLEHCIQIVANCTDFCVESL